MISFIENDNKFNFRLGAVIISQDRTRVLLHKKADYDFYLLPGGRLEFMELSAEGIKRELAEELGLEDVSPSLIATVENFFVFEGMHYHEVSDNYVVYLNANHSRFEKEIRILGKEGDQYIYDWVPIAKLAEVKLRPAILSDIIRWHHQGAKRYVIDERAAA